MFSRRFAGLTGLVLAAAAAAGAGENAASGGTIVNSPVTFTGNVGTDFPTNASNGIVQVAGQTPAQVGQASWITQQGWVNGWVMKDMRLNYVAATDTMQVGVQFYNVAGSVDGNGTPGSPDPRTVAAGGLDPAHLGGRDSITVAFAPDASPTNTASSGTPVIVAGVPTNKSQAASGTLDNFTVSTYYPSNEGIQYNYGAQLAGNNGGLAFDPSKAHPDFEFTIKNFSKIPGLNPKTGFWVQAFAGSPDDVVAGESYIQSTRVPGFLTKASQTIPEPTTVAAWAVLALGVGLRVRRSRRTAQAL